MRTQLAYETRNSLENQRVGKRRIKTQRTRTIGNQKVRGKISRLKRILLIAGGITSATLAGGILGNTAYNSYNRVKINQAWDNLVAKYGDIDEEVGVSAQEKDALFKRVLMPYGMRYENKTLLYSATGRKASSEDLRKALENYTQPIITRREK